jgi:hypothetical protein
MFDCLGKLMKYPAAKRPPFVAVLQTSPAADSPTPNAGVFRCRPSPGTRRWKREPRLGFGIRSADSSYLSVIRSDSQAARHADYGLSSVNCTFSAFSSEKLDADSGMTTNTIPGMF